ncbi:family S53 protease [Stereum hirsutum FP-91666 SS1]|uniref:family S53 protease n=1 Tax=Stereum hirsutum (strain FP-91666) TaxID=721885 RepID=UPI0004449B0B|nr:family S53 protease [Stereum hirsutum FP-91666 SS1]EIM82411.1 family S53 protease [Stereum hirsutum FP-91666 SS1]
MLHGALSVSVALSLVTLAWSKPLSQSRRDMVVHERRDSPPSGFVQDGAAPADQVLSLRFVLSQSDFSGLESALYAVSTPGNSRYRQFLSKEEVEAFVAPSNETSSAFSSWLSSNNLTSTPISAAGDWLSVNITVSQANDLLSADFSTFTHETTGQSTVRTLEYSVPASLQSHISLVHPTVAFPTSPVGPITGTQATVPPPKAAISSNGSSTSPSCLQSLYGIPTTAATQQTNILAVSGFGSQYANEQDLTDFLAQFRTDISSSTTFTLESVDGGTNDQTLANAGDEANLDIQYTVGLATGVPVQFLSVGSQTTDGIDGFIDEINFMLAESTVPNVLTTSYAFNEPDLPLSLATNLCNAYAQLGARGTSAFVASGDGGVSGVQSQSCTTFVPTFPSTCPYITSVGGSTGVNPEVAASLSGGGFSNLFAVPDYQSDVVSSWKSGFGTSTYSGLYNTTGRGVPDVAAQAENFYLRWKGAWYLVGGTSAASPTFASVISLLDDELVAAGKAPLGFLNPLIYSNSQAFTDITSGDNPGCSTNGFSATTSWDPVTGMGTPIYSALKTAAGL